MSAVPKPDVIPIRAVEPAPDEPRFLGESELFDGPFWGKHEHDDADLRMMWSRIWRCFKSHELCKGFIKYNRVHSLEVWCAAFEQVRIMKNENFKYIRYVKSIGDTYTVDETPEQKLERESKEVEEKLAAKAKRDAMRQEPSPVVLKYWSDKAKTPSIHDIPRDDPDLLRVTMKLKGDRTR